MNNEELILNKLMEVSENIGAIKQAVDKVHDLEKRVSSLESTRDQDVGAQRRTTILSHIISVIVGWAIAYFTGHH
jgi:hypothetical protein